MTTARTSPPTWSPAPGANWPGCSIPPPATAWSTSPTCTFHVTAGVRGTCWARALAGAAALAVAIAVLPQITGSSSSHRSPAAAGAPSPAIHLASSEFTVLSKQLIAADASPAAILAAGRSWQSAVTRDLPSAASAPASASDLVTMLRAERTLLQVSPTLHAPQNRAVATTLATQSDSLLAQLRRLADPQVLAILPAAIQALPISAPAKPTTPVAGATAGAGDRRASRRDHPGRTADSADDGCHEPRGSAGTDRSGAHGQPPGCRYPRCRSVDHRPADRRWNAGRRPGPDGGRRPQRPRPRRITTDHGCAGR